MKLFIEKSIKEIQNMLLSGNLIERDLMEECIEKSKKYEIFKFWKSFDEIIFRERYDELINPIKALNCQESILATIPRNPTYPYYKGKDTMYAIPFGVKDVFNTIDYTTEMGSIIWKGFYAGNDARTVSNLIYHKGIVAGKTVTAEFAVHSLNETLNPYDIERTPGTSSSGSAVATALGVIPFALATQTAGSIIRPASFCGVFGFKPSFGTVPRTGVLKTTDSLDSVGFVTSNVYNLKYVFDVISVKGLDYPYQYRAFSDKERQVRGNRKWKIGFAKTYIWKDAENYVKESVCEFVNKLSKDPGIDVEEICIDDVINGAHNIHEVIYNKSLSYYFENEHNDRERVSLSMMEMLDKGDGISNDQFKEALKEQNDMCKNMDEIMEKYDAIISISTASVAPIRGEVEKDDPSLIWTLTHLCSISSPLSMKDGLPFGIQISGRRYNDYLLLELVEYLAERGYIPKYSNTKL